MWQISFHIEQSRRRREIFHNFRKEIISHFAVRRNISLKKLADLRKGSESLMANKICPAGK